METRDQSIIDGFFARQETAIQDASEAYGGYCRTIADHILQNREDTEECLNDTWLKAWNTIPPTRPDSLRAYLGRITRNLAISRFRKSASLKRGGTTYTLALDELTAIKPRPSTATTASVIATILPVEARFCGCG